MKAPHARTLAGSAQLFITYSVELQYQDVNYALCSISHAQLCKPCRHCMFVP